MDNSDMVQLYTSFKGDSTAWLDLHHKHFTQFVTITLALLAASLGVAYRLKGNGLLLLLTAIGPSFNIWLCFIATRTCDRFYQRFLEHEAIANKLFTLLDLPWPPSSETLSNPIFTDDEQLYPQRWTNAYKDCKTIDQFVKQSIGRGSNILIRVTFRALAVLNAALIVLLFLVWLFKC